MRKVAENRIAEMEQIKNRFLDGKKGKVPIDRDVLIERMKNEDIIVLDVRPSEEFNAGHILGARQIKPEEVREKNFKKLENSKDKPIIVVCAMGNQARGTANAMQKDGFANVNVLKGGMNAWQSASLPVSK